MMRIALGVLIVGVVVLVVGLWSLWREVKEMSDGE